jgi:hypothetical protein
VVGHKVDGFKAEGTDVYEANGVTFTDEINDFAAVIAAMARASRTPCAASNGTASTTTTTACMTRRTITPGNPAYSFNGVDDLASRPVAA